MWLMMPSTIDAVIIDSQVESPTLSVPPPEVYPATGNRSFAILLCRFSDFADGLKSASFYQTAFDFQYPHIGHYWSEVSFGKLNIDSSQVYGWYTLPNPRASYFDLAETNLTTQERTNLWNDCTAAADTQVDFTKHYGVILVFEDWPSSKPRYGNWLRRTLEGQTRIWGMAYLSANDFSHSLATVKHEMGHTFSMSHSLGPNGAAYVNRWDIMSDTQSDCFVNPDANDSNYGCIGQHPLAYHKYSVGWFSTEQVTTVHRGETTSVAINNHEQSLPTDIQLVLLETAIDNKLYTIETRKRIGYDVKLPFSGVIIHTVQPDSFGQIQPRLIDGDNDGDLLDDAVVWVPGETYRNEKDEITICIESITPSGYEIAVASVSTLSCNFEPRISLNHARPNVIAYAGETITITSSLKNTGIPVEPIHGVVTLPNPLTFVTESATIEIGQISFEEEKLTFDIGQIDSGDEISFTYAINIPASYSHSMFERILTTVDWPSGGFSSELTIAINPNVLFIPLIQNK